MKKNVLLTFLVSALTLSSFSIAEAADYPENFDGEVYPISGRSGRIYDVDPMTERMTPNTIFSFRYEVSAGGYMDTGGTTKYLTPDEISKDVVAVDSIPGSTNGSGTMKIGLGYYSSDADAVLTPNRNIVEFGTDERGTKYIYSPDLSEDRYYGTVKNKSRQSIYGKINICDLT